MRILFPASAKSANTAALLSLRSSFIASLHSFVSSSVSLWLPEAPAKPCWRMSSGVSEDRLLFVAFPLSKNAFFSFQNHEEVLNQSLIFLVDIVNEGIFPRCRNNVKELPVVGHSGSSLLKLCSPFFPLCEVEFCMKETVVRSRLNFRTTMTSVRQNLRLNMMWSISLWNCPLGDSHLQRLDLPFWNG